jgi:D-alanine-D-alanine ligase
MEWAAIAHDQLGCRGISRSDFRFNDATGELIMLELNTQPGMTNTSLVPEQAEYKGISMGALVSSLLEAAQCD